MRCPRSPAAASAAYWATPSATSPVPAARQTARRSGSASPIPIRREPVSDAERDGRLTVDGDRLLAERFTRMFPSAGYQP
jgi:hypothetical protein